MPDLNLHEASPGANLIPEAHEQLRILQDAAEALASTRTIDAEDRSTALTAAHRLAHLLDGGGASEAAQHTRELETTLHHPGLPQPERLQEQVQALARLLFSDPQK